MVNQGSATNRFGIVTKGVGDEMNRKKEPIPLFYYTDPQGIRWDIVNVRKSFTPGFILADRVKDGKTIRITTRSMHAKAEQ